MRAPVEVLPRPDAGAFSLRLSAGGPAWFWLGDAETWRGHLVRQGSDEAVEVGVEEVRPLLRGDGYLDVVACVDVKAGSPTYAMVRVSPGGAAVRRCGLVQKARARKRLATTLAGTGAS